MHAGVSVVPTRLVTMHLRAGQQKGTSPEQNPPSWSDRRLIVTPRRVPQTPLSTDMADYPKVLEYFATDDPDAINIMDLKVICALHHLLLWPRRPYCFRSSRC